MRFLNALERQSRFWLYLEAYIYVLLVGVVDYVTPAEFTLIVFYIIPVMLVALVAGTRQAIYLAFFTTLVWWFANISTHHGTIHSFVWRGISRTISLSAIAVGGAAMRQQRDIMRARVHDMERTRELEEAIVRISEREQMRIGQDLHDGICQHMAAIDFAIECLKHDLAEKNLPETEAASAIHEQLRQTMIEARDLARGIFPVQINEEGLVAALDELVANTNRAWRVPIRLNTHDEIKIADPQAAMHLYRIAQEALSNACKHAHPSEVEIDLESNGSNVVLTVTDNGIGLGNAAPAGGMGLQTMRYRARLLAGAITFENNPAGGLVVRCSVDLSSTHLT